MALGLAVQLELLYMYCSMSSNPITHCRYHLDDSAPLNDKSQYKFKDGLAYEDKTTNQVRTKWGSVFEE